MYWCGEGEEVESLYLRGELGLEHVLGHMVSMATPGWLTWLRVHVQHGTPPGEGA